MYPSIKQVSIITLFLFLLFTLAVNVSGAEISRGPAIEPKQEILKAGSLKSNIYKFLIASNK